MLLKQILRRRSSKDVLIILLAGIIVLLPGTRLSKAATISARMENLFRDMGFRSAETAPGVYESQSRGFFVGGSLKGRSQTESIQPLSMKMPDIKAGCGGIDIFGGSFSFVNADQLIDFLKAVGPTKGQFPGQFLLTCFNWQCSKDAAKRKWVTKSIL